MRSGAVSKALKNAGAVAKAHQMKSGAVSKALKNAGAVAKAHQAKSGAVSKALQKTSVRIEFDPNTEEYKVQD
jgi:hypothetical protein